MADYFSGIQRIIEAHYAEAAYGLVDSSPSRLRRGEGVEQSFYILKVDLVDSTKILLNRSKATYLKLAHTFLSTIDKITQDFGADGGQAEYAGDSVTAYFNAKYCDANDVIQAAAYCKGAVDYMKKLDQTLRSLNFQCKMVLHYDVLTIAKIGPQRWSFLTALGYPLHTISKIEKQINMGTGRATKKFYEMVPRGSRKYFIPEHIEISEAPKLPKLQPLQPATYFNFGGLLNQPPPGLGARRQKLKEMAFNLEVPMQSATTTKLLIGYDLNWPHLYHDLEVR